MLDQLDDAFVARLSALAPEVDMAASLALFERERQHPRSRPSRVLLPAAAAVLVVGGVGIWAVAGPNDEPAGPISTISPTTTVVEGPTTTLSPTASTLPEEIITPLPATTVAGPADPTTTTAPASEELPSGLTTWPPRSTVQVPLDAVPRLLPTVPVGNASRVIAGGGTADMLGDYDYVQSWYRNDGGGYVSITSNIGQAPGSAASRTPVITDGWPTSWSDAYLLSTSTTETLQAALVSDDGVVEISSSGVTEANLLDIARTLERRPFPEAGWNVPGLPAGFVPFGESGDSYGASRHLLWTTDDGTIVAELLLESANANLLTTGWWPGDVDVEIIDLGGTEAVLLDIPGRVAIAWPLPDGGHALFGFTGSRADAEAIVRSLTVVDQATWENSTEPPDPGRDGCESLFC